MREWLAIGGKVSMQRLPLAIEQPQFRALAVVVEQPSRNEACDADRGISRLSLPDTLRVLSGRFANCKQHGRLLADRSAYDDGATFKRGRQ